MRLHFEISSSRFVLPYNYQNRLAGAIHKWIGPDNRYHGKSSLYSFSLLNGGENVENRGLRFPRGGQWFISAFQPEFIKRIMEGVLRDPNITEDLSVREMTLQEDPSFGQAHVFKVGSPVLVKQRRPDTTVHHCTFSEETSDLLLTENLRGKLLHGGLSADDVKVEFRRDYPGARAKVLRYNNISNRVNFCPIAISGTPEQLAFAWNVGVGNSTGIGYGSLV